MEKKAAAKKDKNDFPKKKPEKAAPKTGSKETLPTKKDFLVVGLGASAGGVKALQEFFASIPPNSGMAFVVILHLSPQHESSLPQILQAQTMMPVVQVKETYKVEPNNVYVIPPNSQLKMLDGNIYCAPPEAKTGARVAIDVFFRTLAEAYQQNAVCVVLSGTGSDGTLGLKRVKESNGFAIVQSPEDAEYDQMPRNAIATGLADWILPVRRMPDKLIHFRGSSERLHLTNGASAEKVAEEINAEDSLREIITILRVRTGHDFANYKTPTLVRRIARHLQIHELEDLPTYVSFLRDNAEEIQSLQRNLLINVTNFFRDKEAFAALETGVIPRLFTGKTARDTVRVWTAGCASGEEAFSLAMLLTEYAEKQSEPPKFMIFATDIDDGAIAQAREHLYPESIEVDVSPERLKRFFVRDGSRFRIRKELRETVLFAPHNVLRDPPFSRLDLVTCRNVLIYLNREAQKHVMEIFHFALKSDSFLFLGSSESTENAAELFEAIEKKQRLYRRRPAPHGYHAPPRMPAAGNWQTNLQIGAGFAERARISSLGEMHYKLLENLAPPSVLVNENFDVVYMSQSIGRYLRFTGGEPSNNLLKLVSPELLPDLRAALFTAQRDHLSSEFTDLHAVINGRETLINLSVRVVEAEDGSGNFLLVIFEEADENKLSLPAKTSGKKTMQPSDRDEAVATIIKRLEQELQRSRASLRATVEQHEVSTEELKASNEELQAINEELRSATEELETSKEELQSVNEEMTTVNSELKDKIEEAARNNSDLHNLLVSTDIATIFLDRQLRIKRFSPLIEQLFNITPVDIGRPLEHFTHRLEYEYLAADAKEVLKNLKTVEREIADKEGRYFLTRFSPYRTVDDHIEGVVLNFLEITKYKRAEEALHNAEEGYRVQLEHEVETRTAELEKSKEQFTSLIENTPDVITRWDKNLNLVYANGAFEAKTGVSNEILFGRTNSDTAQPDEVSAPYMECVQKVFDTGEPCDHFDHFPTADGEAYFHSRIVPEKNERGEIETVLAIARDITEMEIPRREREQVQQSLHESEERLRIAVEAAELATWVWDLKKNEVTWNERHYRLFGMAARVAPQPPRLFFDHLYPEDSAWVTERLEQAIKNNATFSAEFRIEREDGAIRWMEGYGHVVEMEDGKPVKASGVMSDITERKRAETALRESEARLQLLMESVKDYAIVTTDLQGIIIDWNKGAENVFGWKADEIVGKPIDIIFTPEDRAANAPLLERRTALQNGRAADERWHLRKDGSRFYVSGMMTTLADGEVEGFVKIARDETQKREAEKSVREKETLRRLVAGQEDERRRLARDLHDHLGQQLTTLRLKLEAVSKDCDDLPDLCDKVDESLKITRRIDADVGFLAWELRPASLDDLGLAVALHDYVREWQFHSGIKAELHISGLNVIKVPSEVETTIYRIAQETLNNIYKHAKASHVAVIVKRQDGDVILIVEDDGIGFSPKKTRLKKSGAKSLGLTGIGERAALVGGTVEIESKKGKGTTVFVRIPYNGLPGK